MAQLRAIVGVTSTGAMRKMVLSHTLVDDPPTRREIRSGDAVEHLRELKEQDGADIIATFGLRALAPLADTPGLIDAYLLVTHPAVLASGPRATKLSDVPDGPSSDSRGGLEHVDLKSMPSGQ